MAKNNCNIQIIQRGKKIRYIFHRHLLKYPEKWEIKNGKKFLSRINLKKSDIFDPFGTPCIFWSIYTFIPLLSMMPFTKSQYISKDLRVPMSFTQTMFLSTKVFLNFKNQRKSKGKKNMVQSIIWTALHRFFSLKNISTEYVEKIPNTSIRPILLTFFFYKRYFEQFDPENRNSSKIIIIQYEIF